MDRRTALLSLTAGSVFALGGCAAPPDATAGLTDGEIERFTRHLTGVTLAPGQAAGVRDMFEKMRFTGDTDRAVQPAISFDPEVDGD
jgi:hypothetical protein